MSYLPIFRKLEIIFPKYLEVPYLVETNDYQLVKSKYVPKHNPKNFTTDLINLGKKYFDYSIFFLTYLSSAQTKVNNLFHLPFDIVISPCISAFISFNEAWYAFLNYFHVFDISYFLFLSILFSVLLFPSELPVWIKAHGLSSPIWQQPKLRPFKRGCQTLEYNRMG